MPQSIHQTNQKQDMFKNNINNINSNNNNIPPIASPQALS